MKKLLTLLAGAALMIGMATGMANATPITFIDTTSFGSLATNETGDLIDYGYGSVNKLDGVLDFVTWEHQFQLDPAASNIISGLITLSLKDDNDIWFEFAFGFAESGQWNIGEVNTSTYASTVTTSYLEDGKFQVTLASLGGDFYIDKSVLEVTYEPVPEPGTMVLLGVGMLGLAIFGKRRMNKEA